MASAAVLLLALCCWQVLAGGTGVLGSDSWECQQGVNCHLPDCRCPSDHSFLGTRHVPQIVHFAFDDALNEVMAGYYRQLFRPDRRNPNGCPVTMTLFVQNAYTDYKLVHEFYKRGMEIGVHGLAHLPVTSPEELRLEASSQRENLALLGQVPRKEIVGWRSPNLRTAGDAQPRVLRELGYMYDVSLPYTRRQFGERTPFPYTLDFGYPYSCTVEPCPSQDSRHPGFWEVPVNSWMDHEGAYPCSYVDGCVNRPGSEEDAFQYLWRNFADYYNGTRAPFGVNMHASWFFEPRNFRAMDRFLSAILKLDDVYVLSVRQMLDWVMRPLSLGNIWKLASWSCPDPWDDRSLSHPTPRPTPSLHWPAATLPPRSPTSTSTPTRDDLFLTERRLDDFATETTTTDFRTPGQEWYWEKVKEFYHSGKLRWMSAQKELPGSAPSGKHWWMNHRSDRKLPEETLKDDLDEKAAETDTDEDKSASWIRRGRMRTTLDDSVLKRKTTSSHAEQITTPVAPEVTPTALTTTAAARTTKSWVRRTRVWWAPKASPSPTTTSTTTTTTPTPTTISTSPTTTSTTPVTTLAEQMQHAGVNAPAADRGRYSTWTRSIWTAATTGPPSSSSSSQDPTADMTIRKSPFSVWPPTKEDCWQESNCQLPHCYCRSTNVPGGLWPRDTPQMVFFTFDGALDQRVYSYFSELFNKSRRNADSCPIKATFFVDRARSSYRLIQQLEKSGMEISLKGVDYHSDWQQMNVARYMRVQLEQVARSMTEVTMRGWRSSETQPLGDAMFQALRERDFLYDSSLVLPVNGNWNAYFPWPYTLDFGWRESCAGDEGCPQGKHPGLWEIPIQPVLDPQGQFQCLFADGCTNRPQTEQETFDFLMKNFEHHYRGNRTPFGVHLRSQWFWHHLYAPNRRGLDRFIREMVAKNDVYVVSMKQIIEWMTNPTPLSQMERFGPWNC